MYSKSIKFGVFVNTLALWEIGRRVFPIVSKKCSRGLAYSRQTPNRESGKKQRHAGQDGYAEPRGASAGIAQKAVDQFVGAALPLVRAPVKSRSAQN
jgi:hypothetical protein